MSSAGKFGWPVAGLMQAALALAILPIAALAPPTHGRMLLIPLHGKPVSPVMLQQLMLTPVRDGPLPGSIIVEGMGWALAGGLLKDGILMVAATTSMCVGGDRTGDKREH